LLARGAGLSLPRLAMAFRTTPSGFPSFAGRSNNTVSTPALVRCAAICAPITPAPSTATLRTSNLLDMLYKSLFINWKCSVTCADTGFGETDQLACGALTMGGFGNLGGALDQAEVGHGIGQGTGQEVEPPVQFFLAQAGHAARYGLAE